MKKPGESTSQPKNLHEYAALRPLARFAGISPRDLVVSVGPIIVLTAIVIGGAFWIVRPAPPDTITIAGGPDRSSFRGTAEKYKKILARNGVKLRILQSGGSLDNLRMLSNPA